MTIKEFIISRIQLFILLVTLIFAVSMVIGLIFTPEAELHYYQLIGPFILANAHHVFQEGTYRKAVHYQAYHTVDLDRGRCFDADSTAGQGESGDF